MKIIELKVMRGPNIWSGYRKKLIVMKLDLEEMENFPTDKIPGFAERLVEWMPTLQTHRCSEEEEGGFLMRVRKGTWMGHVAEHIALELQTLAGMDCGYGRTRSNGSAGVYYVVFSYEHERAGLYAAEAAVRFTEAVINNTPYNIDDDIVQLKKIKRYKQFGPSTSAIVKEAESRGIPFTRLSNESLVMFGQGCNQRIIQATETGDTSSIGSALASDKEATRRLLASAYVPVPKGTVIMEDTELQEAIDEIGFPLVIKPLDGNHGRGVTTNIYSLDEAIAGFKIAQKISEDVIVEEFIRGIDYRFLVINYKLVSVAKRIPALVVGDGSSSIQQLIDEVNKDPRRGAGHENVLTLIKVDEGTMNILRNKNLSPESILPIGETLFLKDTANISSGGTARDVTDLVHPENIFLAERIARLLHLDICGIDIMADDINVPITQNKGAVIEVNSGPGLRMHLSPSKGLGRNVAAPIVDMLYPENAPARIPLVAVTGTNGKTTVTRLVAHFARAVGHNVGFTTTDGIYINDKAIYRGDCSGPSSAAVVLRDPLIDFAVLECARGGIIRSGLGFDNCNISIVTNVSDDHLGLNDVNTINDLAKVKAVVPQSTFDNGYAILNADDDLVYDMRHDLDCNIALFSMDAENIRIQRHRSNGGMAAIIEKGYFVICKGEWKTRVIKIAATPITFNGTAEFMIQNVLPAILAASISNLTVPQIAGALKTFIPSPQLTPGRMNMFQFPDFRMMVDYAHNNAGFMAVKKFISQVNASVKTGIISATGDRREEDIRAIGRHAAETFDEIIIKHDRDCRGRTHEELTLLLKEGIHQVRQNIPVIVISDEVNAIHYAIEHAKEDAFIFIGADDIQNTLNIIEEAQNNQNSFSYASKG